MPVFLVAYTIITFVILAFLDKIQQSKLTELKVELEKDVEAEQFTEREKGMLKRVTLWSRIRNFIRILLYIGLILMILYRR